MKSKHMIIYKSKNTMYFFSYIFCIISIVLSLVIYKDEDAKIKNNFYFIEQNKLVIKEKEGFNVNDIIRLKNAFEDARLRYYFERLDFKVDDNSIVNFIGEPVDGKIKGTDRKDIGDNSRYFSIKFKYGRDFIDADFKGEYFPIIISEFFSTLYFGMENSLGKRIIMRTNDYTYEAVVVGVFYDSLLQTENFNNFIINSNKFSTIVFFPKQSLNEESLIDSILIDAKNKSVSMISKVISDNFSFEIIDFKSHESQIRNMKEKNHSNFKYVYVPMSIISLLIYMIISFFYYKEKRTEFGIILVTGASFIELLKNVMVKNLVNVFSTVCISVTTTIIWYCYKSMKEFTYFDRVNINLKIEFFVSLTILLYAFFFIVNTCIFIASQHRRVGDYFKW
ncbi:acidobacterial duplicated orphan permease [Haploplasma axanthum]|uniref:Acidobacterial duplicated orphan permease n=2 Tax=Haploplasma axanthum TaxID=29552 RepID=A0A449BBS8_HAPAX|nr:acidobacterial duplicated orphan permease [Haploplasma axanthum]